MKRLRHTGCSPEEGTTRYRYTYDIDMTISSGYSEYWDGTGYSHLHQAGTPHLWEYDVLVSGQDYHLTVHYTEIGLWTEVITAGDTTYGREDLTRGQGAWERAPERLDMNRFVYQLPSMVASEASNPVCPNLQQAGGASGASGSETIDGVSTTRYTITFAHDITPRSSGASGASGSSDTPTPVPQIVDYTWDVWIAQDGQLIQSKEFSVAPLLKGRTERQSMTILSKISGVGEANVITAPELAGS